MTTDTFADHGIDVPWNASGENVRAKCPECTPNRSRTNQNAKDLSVNVTKGTWFCHHCGWTGGLGAADWRDSVSGDTRRGMRVEQAKEYRKPERKDVRELPPSYLGVLERRGIPPEFATAAGLSVERRKCPECQTDVDALAIPYYRDNEIIHVKYRHTAPGGKRHFWSTYQTEREFYGLDALVDASVGVIVEGEIDKISVDVVGGWACASVPDGAPAVGAKNYATKFAFMEGRAAPILAKLGTVILATDTDEPGNVLADELARRIGPEKCRRVEWPEGCKDANETLQKHGAEAVNAALLAAREYPVSGIYTFDDVWADMERRYAHGVDEGKRTGLVGLDDIVRWREGLFYVVTGMPSHGKSIVLDEVAARLARRHGWVVGVCSPENQPLSDHAGRIAAHVIGKPFNDGPTPRMSLDELRSYRQWFKEHYAFILPSTASVDEILRLAKIEVYRRGLNMLIIDPWTEIEHKRPASMREDEWAAQECSKLSKFAKEQKVCTVLVAHPTKMFVDQKTKQYPVPRLYNISGGAAFRNKADVGLSVYRDESDPLKPTEVHVQKIRFRETGRHGQYAELRYEAATERFFDVMGEDVGEDLGYGDPWDVAPKQARGVA